MINHFQGIEQALNAVVPWEPGEWERFSKGLQIQTYRKGEFVIKAGAIENYIYFINKGSTRNYFIKDGKEFTVDFHFHGAFVTSYYSLITREPSDIFIELLEDSELVVIPLNYLQLLYNEFHTGERRGRIIAEHQYAQRIRKEMELLSRTAEQRYSDLLEKNPSLIQQISVKHLATYLGVQPESLSRIRKLHKKN